MLTPDGRDTSCRIFSVDGKLWVGEWVEHNNAAKPYGEYSIILEATRDYVPTGENGWLPDAAIDAEYDFLSDEVVYWEYSPNLSSVFPAFPFDFVFSSDCDKLEFSCENGSLLLRNGQVQDMGQSFTVTGRYETVYWSPTGENDLAVPRDTLTFKVYRQDEEVGSGAIYIRLTSRDGARSTYAARAALSNTDHYYFIEGPNTEFGGAQIGGGPNYWPPITFTAMVLGSDPDMGTVTVEPETPLTEELQVFLFAWWEPSEFKPGDRVLVTARNPHHKMAANWTGLGTFDQVDEMVQLSGPLAEWSADLTHDGMLEQVYVTRVADSGDYFNIIVENAAGDVLWHESASGAHAGQNGLYLYRDNGGDHLLRWVPYMSSGTGGYSFQLFTLSQQGEEQVVNKASILVDYEDFMTTDVTELRDFERTINELLDNSVVLLSTNGDTPEGVCYGDPDDPVIPIGPWDGDVGYFEALQARAQGTYTFIGEITLSLDDHFMVRDTTLWTDMGWQTYVFSIPNSAMADDPELYREGAMVSVTADGPLYMRQLPDESTHVEARAIRSTLAP